MQLRNPSDLILNFLPLQLSTPPCSSDLLVAWMIFLACAGVQQSFLGPERAMVTSNQFFGPTLLFESDPAIRLGGYFGFSPVKASFSAADGDASLPQRPFVRPAAKGGFPPLSVDAARSRSVD